MSDKHTHPLFALSLLALAAASGCTTGAVGTAPPEPGVFAPTSHGPEGAPPGTCWGKTVSPAVVERVSQRVEVTPAKVNPDGTIAELPVYETQDRQVIVTARKDNWFETPCPAMLTPEFVASLQRALTARGFFAGAITGVMDNPTRAAIQLFQKPEGPDSPVLALSTARALGLIAVPRSADG